jgi:serine/threonine protein kinase
VEKVSKAFGVPVAVEAGAHAAVPPYDRTDLSYADWYLALQSQSPSLAADEKDGDDTSLQFSIKAHGEDLDMLSSLVSFSLLNAVVQQAECYSLQTPPERLVHCEVFHHASMTEHLLAYLESVFEGVRFLCHYELPYCVDDEDAELLYIARRSTRHPLCSHNLSSVLDEGKSADDSVERSATRLDSKNDFNDAKEGSFRSGQGALVGIDLSVVLRSLVCIDSEGAAPELLPPDLAKHVRPLSERLRFFSGRAEDFEEAGWLFSLVHRMQYLALNSSVDGPDSDLDLDPRDVDGDNDSYAGEQEVEAMDDAQPAEERAPRNTAKLDNEYRHARLKIVDLGNACWTYKHFTDDIQTRQYRAPEVLVGAPYDTSADMWSVACIVFELLTGDLMFDPQAGKNWNREEDHLALMMELLGKFPTSLLPKGKFSQDYFTKKGELKHIHNLNFWGLEGVLMEKYKFSEIEAAEVAEFLLPLLEVTPALRNSVLQCSLLVNAVLSPQLRWIRRSVPPPRSVCGIHSWRWTRRRGRRATSTPSTSRSCISSSSTSTWCLQ